MLTFIIKIIVCAVIGYFPYVMLPVGMGSIGYPKGARYRFFEDAQYVQIKDTGMEVRADGTQ